MVERVTDKKKLRIICPEPCRRWQKKTRVHQARTFATQRNRTRERRARDSFLNPICEAHRTNLPPYACECGHASFRADMRQRRAIIIIVVIVSSSSTQEDVQQNMILAVVAVRLWTTANATGNQTAPISVAKNRLEDALIHTHTHKRKLKQN